MQLEIVVPTIGESVTEAVVSSLIAAEGGTVSEGQEILELETDKVNQVLYAPKAGKLSLFVSVGDKVKVGQKVASVDTDAKASEVKNEKMLPSEKVQTPSPLPVKKLETIAPSSKSSSEKGSKKKMSSLRKTIAAKLVEVKNKTAMLTTFNEVDMSEVMKLRAEEKDKFADKYGVKLGLMSFFVKAAEKALGAYPVVCSGIEGDEIITPSTFDIGIAVSTDKGLIVPVLRNCETLSFGRIELAIAQYAKKARDGKIGIDDIQGGSFTITNGGVFGSLLSTPIINPSQSAILGMHAIVKRPVAIEDKVEIRPMMYLALSYDHRIIDGKEAVLFLVHMKDLLENPSKLTEGDEFFKPLTNS